jgi:hypothetical protein
VGQASTKLQCCGWTLPDSGSLAVGAVLVCPECGKRIESRMTDDEITAARIAGRTAFTFEMRQSEYDEMQGEIDRLREFAAWIETWVSNPAGGYSTAALDGLFGMTRDRLAALAKLRP